MLKRRSFEIRDKVRVEKVGADHDHSMYSIKNQFSFKMSLIYSNFEEQSGYLDHQISLRASFGSPVYIVFCRQSLRS
jgi:hypothetical protein